MSQQNLQAVGSVFDSCRGSHDVLSTIDKRMGYLSKEFLNTALYDVNEIDNIEEQFPDHETRCYNESSPVSILPSTSPENISQGGHGDSLGDFDCAYWIPMSFLHGGTKAAEKFAQSGDKGAASTMAPIGPWSDGWHNIDGWHKNMPSHPYTKSIDINNVNFQSCQFSNWKPKPASTENIEDCPTALIKPHDSTANPCDQYDDGKHRHLEKRNITDLQTSRPKHSSQELPVKYGKDLESSEPSTARRKRGRRRKPLTYSQRRAAAQVRVVGACLNCRKSHKKVRQASSPTLFFV